MTVGEQIGANVRGLLGGILNPLTDTLGKTTSEEITTSDAATQSSRRTMTIVIAVLAVITVGIAAWALFKKS